MPSKRRHSSSSSLSPIPDTVEIKKKPKVQKVQKAQKSVTGKATGTGISPPTDEFQQVTKPDFVDRYRLKDLGYGGDVYYQPDVRSL